MPLFQLTEELVFPPPEAACDDGLLAIGGDLRPERLLMAYSMGIFPWYDEASPILWWSPDPRLVLAPSEFHASRRLRRTLRQGLFRVSMDEAFEEVIRRCATAPREGQDGTWITGDMVEAYCRLHALGYAHSVECWRGEQLAGGLYGISLGACFFGESMFSKVPNASKTALAHLCKTLDTWQFSLIDCQMATPHLASLGAKEISRKAFLDRVRQGLRGETRVGKWRLPETHAGLATPK